MLKLNLGCGPSWKKEGWTGYDHSQSSFFSSEAWRLPYANETFDIVFSSHMLEHIPVQRLEETFSEINRILKPGGTFRFLTPDFFKLCRAYVENDETTMKNFIIEDSSGIPNDLGLAQALLGFVHGPGYDNVLLSARGDEVTACVGHVSMLDYKISAGILSLYGFMNIKKMEFCDSAFPELKEPWHLAGEPAVWKQPGQLDIQPGQVGVVPISTGFDRDPLVSLIVECQKERYVRFDENHPRLYGGPYPKLRRSKKLLLIRTFTHVARFINGIFYWTNGLLRKLGA